MIVDCYHNTHFDKKSQSVFFEGIKAEDVMLAAFGQGNQVPETVDIDWLSF